MSATCWLVSSLGDARVPLIPGSEGDRCGDSPICKGVTPLHREVVFFTSCATRIANSQNGLVAIMLAGLTPALCLLYAENEHDICILAILTPDSERALSKKEPAYLGEAKPAWAFGRQATDLVQKLSVHPGTVSSQDICTTHVYLIGVESSMSIFSPVLYALGKTATFNAGLLSAHLAIGICCAQSLARLCRPHTPAQREADTSPLRIPDTLLCGHALWHLAAREKRLICRRHSD